ncbi:MAG: hypothetical protein HFK03_06545 [Clostridia bacterium]|nr:hypothetical protein [Clostridia bacterium]
MANGRYDYDNAEQVQRVPKKADVILKRQQEMALKQDDAIAKVNAANARIDEVMAELAKVREESAEALRRNEELFGTVGESVAALRRELRYLAAQNESIYNSVSDKFEKLGGEVNGLSSPVHPAEDEAALTEAVAAEPVPFNAEIDYDTLAAKVAERIEVPAPQVVSDGVPVQTIVRENAEIDYDVLVDKIVARLPMQEGAAQSVQAEIDYDTLAARVAERIALPAAAAAPVYEPVQVSAEIDYDALADKVAERIPAPQVVSDGTPVQTVVHESAEIDYDTLAAKVAERIEVPAPAIVPATVAAEPVQVSAEVDYDLIADKVISRIPVQEVISPDYIASRVAEQLIIPEAGNAQIDYDTLAEKVAERMPAPQLIAEAAPAAAVSENTEIDYEHLAELISEHMPVKETLVTAAGAEIDYEELAGKVAERITIPEAASTAVVANADIDEEELADRIALKIGAIQPDDYNIMVDEEGCASITKEITEKLDYELIASTVADKLRETLDLSGEDNGEQPDYEEMAARISENITVAGVNEDAIAEKAAAVLSNYLPEFDTDEIADKVATQVISALPAAEVDSEAVSNAVAEKLNERQQELDYDIVLDEDGLEKVSASVSENVTKTTEERFDTIDREIEEIKRMLAAGVLVAAPREDDIAPAEAYEEVYEEEAEEEQLVTVSDVIADEPEETVEEEVVEEVTEPEQAVEETPEEELAEEAEEEQPAEEPSAPIVIVTEQTVAEEENENDDEEVVEEFSYDELAGEGGVDFANMMRYNRSFIARIIQGTDEQKTYYGEVRNALLSYKKVNSNIAWGAERFHKGRETIARFKIRGKTLILYLALDPATHEYSVYHHKDVSDNKSVAGTPMMIKVKSPLGVKKAVRLIDEMLAARNGEKRNIPQRDYAAMYPYETIEELIEDGLVKDVKKDK